jgi:hypothetical protein
MKKAIMALIVAAALSAGAVAQGATKTAETKPQPKQTAKAVPVGVPADATEVKEGTWRATDKSGKAWLYIATPFGYRKMAEEDAAKPAPQRNASAAAASNNLKATGVDGDKISFEAPSPFGLRKWTKNRTELSAGEQEALDAYERGAGTVTAKK